MNHRRAHLSRGGAMLETALGVLVLVPVLLYGIHFAELGIVQMKVTETANAALWDATAYPMHITGVPPSYYIYLSQTLQVNQMTTNSRYGVNWDGRMSQLSTSRGGKFTGRAEVQYGQALTGAGMLNLECASTEGLPARLTFAPMMVSNVLQDTPGIACRAEGAAFNLLPTGFLEKTNGGLFKSSIQTTATSSGIHLCSLGRPKGLNGPCAGIHTMMLDDWGLASAGDGAESKTCSLTLGTACSNWPYYTAAKTLYQTALGPIIGTILSAPHRALIAKLLFMTPFFMNQDTDFYMSFMGENAGPPFHAPVIAWDMDSVLWQTTPYLLLPTYVASHAMRSKCYLGVDGC